MTDSVLGLIKPKPAVVQDMDGNDIHILLSRFPATVSRRILCTYPMTALPRLGDYKQNEEVAAEIMKYVAIDLNGQPLRLNTEHAVNSHIPDGETHLKIEMLMMGYNSTFFQSGRLSNFFDECIRMFLAKISETLTRSSQPSSTQNSQPSTNSEQSMT